MARCGTLLLTLALSACDPGSGDPPSLDAGAVDGATLPDGGDAGRRPPPDATDSDGDTIRDLHEGEGRLDTDGDGTPDSEDLDSDDDGYPDAEEAGDADPGTPPVDTDGDGEPDARDFDSDGDGLPDRAEREAGTDRLAQDTDGDGVSDLVEVAAGTDPTDAADDPRSRGDFFFVVPYEEDPTPERDTLLFEAAIRKADVLFLIDTSVSMQPFIDTVLGRLRDRIVPGLSAAIPDVWFGVGEFDILPEDLTPGFDCVGVRNVQPSTGEILRVEAALETLDTPCTGHEPYAQALWLWATGMHGRWAGLADPGCAAGRVGMGCARPDALPIVVLIGDESYRESFFRSDAMVGDAPPLGTLVDAYREISGRVVVLGPTVTASSFGTEIDPDYAALLRRTGSVDAAGEPLLFPDATFESIGDDVVEAIERLASGAALTVSPAARDHDDPDDMGVDATRFIDRLEANLGGVAPCTGGLEAEDRDGDGVIETFVNVPGRTPVCFDIVPAVNTVVPPGDRPRVFRAAVDVIGDGVTRLDTRDVFFLVPPRPDTMVPF